MKEVYDELARTMLSNLETIIKETETILRFRPYEDLTNYYIEAKAVRQTILAYQDERVDSARMRRAVLDFTERWNGFVDHIKQRLAAEAKT